MLLSDSVHSQNRTDQFQISRLKITFVSNHCKGWVSTETAREEK